MKTWLSRLSAIVCTLTLAFTLMAAPAQAFNENDVGKLFETNECIECDLDGADLSFAYLFGANLKGANLKGADLYGAYLNGADLYGAYLDGVQPSPEELRVPGAFLGL